MKYTIILGLFATILAVSAMPEIKRDSTCVIVTRKWVDVVRKCFENVPEDTLNNFMSYNKTTATREIKCLAPCLYKGSGKFVDGKFDLEVVEHNVREYQGPADVLEKLVKIDLAAANAGNAEKGDECDKTYAFHALSGTLRTEAGLEIIFC